MLVQTSSLDDFVSESDMYRLTQPSPKEREPDRTISRLAFSLGEGAR